MTDEKKGISLGAAAGAGAGVVSQPLVFTASETLERHKVPPEKRKLVRTSLIKESKKMKKETKSKNGGRRDLRYDLPREYRSAFNTVINAKSFQDAISLVPSQEFHEIAYWLSQNIPEGHYKKNINISVEH